MVTVLGSSVVDLSFYSDILPSPGETLLGRFEQGLGGKGFNQAVAAKRAGAEVVFYTAFGNDSFQASFQKKLEQEKISYTFFLSPQKNCGAAAILIDQSGENKIVVDIGANAEIPSNFFQENNKNNLSDKDIVLMQLETNLEFLIQSIKYIKSKNKNTITILNPAPADIKIKDNLISLIDYLTPNESEATLLFGDHFYSNTSIENFFANSAIREKIILTRGESGVSFWQKGETHHISAFSVNPVDTSGAGDAFNGGFAAALSNGFSLKESVRYGQAVAALSVQKRGTSASLPEQKEIDALLAK